MSEMQDEGVSSHIGSREGRSPAADRLLESPHRIVVGPAHGQMVVYCDNIEVALLDGHNCSTTFVCTDFRAAIYDFSALYWTHSATMRALQGEIFSTILGPCVCLLSSKWRPWFHSRPGMDDVRILVPLENPRRLQTLEIFELAKRHGF